VADSAPTVDPHAAELKRRFTEGGADGVLSYIDSFDSAERLKLFYSAHQGLFDRDHPMADIDGYIAVVDAGIAEALRRSEAAPTAEESAGLLNTANVMSFNMAANLADCWPGDETVREPRHFERGLRAAEDCVRWRTELKKAAGPFALAWWAAGAHHLFLDQPERAHAAFSKQLNYASDAATAAGQSTEVKPEAPFSVLLAHGYVALSEMLLPLAAGRNRYHDVLHAFDKQIASPDAEIAEDAEFGIAQLIKVHDKYVAGRKDRQKR
jgi:hypothetical protein